MKTFGRYFYCPISPGSGEAQKSSTSGIKICLNYLYNTFAEIADITSVITFMQNNLAINIYI